MSENELIIQVPQSEQLPIEFQEAWENLVKAGDFIPRIQLYGSNSNAVKKELIQQGRYGYPKSGEEIIDLGKEVSCIPLAWAFKAMLFNSNDDPPIVENDPRTEMFAKIKAQADEGGLTGCAYGIEFLLYLPQASGEVQNFVTLFLNSPSSRREAPNFKALIGRAATLKVRLAQNKKGTWHVPQITTCSSPLESVPSQDEVDAKIEQFKNPPKSQNEVASDSEVQAQEGVVR